MSQFTLPAQMIKTYLNRRLEEIPVLQKSLHDGLVVEFNKLGHKILGNARTYGFESLEPLAARMNSLKQEELAEQGPIIISEFKQWTEQAIKQLATDQQKL